MFVIVGWWHKCVDSHAIVESNAIKFNVMGPNERGKKIQCPTKAVVELTLNFNDRKKTLNFNFKDVNIFFYKYNNFKGYNLIS